MKPETKELLVDETKIGDNLTLKQEAFCRFYTQNSELFGNGVLSYAKAYDYDLESFSRECDKNTEGKEIKGTSEYDKAHLTCRASASRLLTNDNIIKRVTELLNEHLQDEVIDAELVKIILNGSGSDKVNAIKEYNKLKQRIVEKSEVRNTVLLGHLSDEQKAGLSLLLEPEKPVDEVKKEEEVKSVVEVQPNEEQAMRGEELLHQE